MNSFEIAIQLNKESFIGSDCVIDAFDKAFRYLILVLKVVEYLIAQVV